MTRRLVGLLAALCLSSACSEDAPVGQMEPIPQLRGKTAPPPAPKPATPAPPPVDASKAVLRWKLTAPLAFEVTRAPGTAAPPPAESPKATRGKKPRKGRAPPVAKTAAPAPEASAAAELERAYTVVLQQEKDREPTFALFPQSGGEPERGHMTERGFVMDGVSGPLRDLAVLVLELPSEPVGPGAHWSVTTTLVDTSGLRGFVQKDATQKNEVTLTALTPGEGGEQVATLEYALTQSVSGSLRAGDPGPVRANAEQSPARAPAPDSTPGKGKKTAGKAEDKSPKRRRARGTLLAGPRTPLSAEVRVTGRGEFLVKAGRWRSFEATVTSRAEGAPVEGLTQGTRVVRVTPVEPVPEALLKRLAKP